MALKKGASRQTNSPVFPPSTGASEPNRSTKSVCSDRLIRVSAFPVAFARADTKLVLPTPGLPSNRIGFLTCIALTTRMALAAVVGALKLKLSFKSSELLTGVSKIPAFNDDFVKLTSTLLE
ncbi:hypothetical protein WICMUC_004614 [Wickerhamomyces mucosus]|uniref:Uncharacterized protein n=1 Tax=Wickerhamomyces mucosus TaxID=1378264 RepID=A0A9P8TAB5_9ASCO|nr:hypothetical protein WICMUC_004614 [Wickerhamomyces mucosus]